MATGDVFLAILFQKQVSWNMRCIKTKKNRNEIVVLQIKIGLSSTAHNMAKISIAFCNTWRNTQCYGYRHCRLRIIRDDHVVCTSYKRLTVVVFWRRAGLRCVCNKTNFSATKTCPRGRPHVFFCARWCDFLLPKKTEESLARSERWRNDATPNPAAVAFVPFSTGFFNLKS